MQHSRGDLQEQRTTVTVRVTDKSIVRSPDSTPQEKGRVSVKGLNTLLSYNPKDSVISGSLTFGETLEGGRVLKG